jgi:small subunit ribosomal protein S9
MSDQVYSTGRRKESIAKVWVSNGSGNIIINKKKIEDYFPDKALRMIINQPLEVAKKSDSVDLKITVLGGGLSGQAGAIKHGLSRALTLIDPNTKDTLKKNGFLTRDSRTVERKKYGRAKARRSFQFSKR